MPARYRFASLLAITLSAVLGSSAHATDLLDVWQGAQSNDPELQMARASHDVGHAYQREADALWRPSVLASAMVGKSDSRTGISGAQFSGPELGTLQGAEFNTSIHRGTATDWSVAAKQPLLSMEKLAQGRQLSLSAELADRQWAGARLQRELTVVDAYFSASLAQQTVKVLEGQLESVNRALAETRERFAQGDVPVTDTHEANARALGLKAQLLAARTDLIVRRATISEMTGIATDALVLHGPRASFTDPGLFELGSLETWLNDTNAGNPDILSATTGLDVARQEQRRYRPEADASIDLVARVARESLTGGGDFGNASNLNRNATIGIQVTVPVFTGGYQSARAEEAAHHADEAMARTTLARHRVDLQTRASWASLDAAKIRVLALEEARKASAERLAATRLGLEVGDRSTLDLLNAQSDDARAELELAQGQLDMLNQRLRLAALADRLDDDLLKRVNAQLDPSPLPTSSDTLSGSAR
jgi:outer membrane protein